MSGSRRLLFALVTVAGAVHSARGFDEPKAKPPHPLVGKWKEVSIEANGNVSFSTSTVLEFTDGHWKSNIRGGETIISGTYRLNDSKNPRWLDQTAEAVEPDRGIIRKESTAGIYKVDGDTLTIAWPALTKDRPEDFATANKPVVVTVWTRVM